MRHRQPIRAEVRPCHQLRQADREKVHSHHPGELLSTGRLSGPRQSSAGGAEGGIIDGTNERLPVTAELAALGDHAIDLDDPAWSCWADSLDRQGPSAAMPGEDWLWREEARRLLGGNEARPLFVSGSSSSMEQFLENFDHVVLLRTSSSTKNSTAAGLPWRVMVTRCCVVTVLSSGSFSPALTQSAPKTVPPGPGDKTAGLRSCASAWSVTRLSTRRPARPAPTKDDSPPGEVEVTKVSRGSSATPWMRNGNDCQLIDASEIARVAGEKREVVDHRGGRAQRVIRACGRPDAATRSPGRRPAPWARRT